jgi:hypothetical protein
VEDINRFSEDRVFLKVPRATPGNGFGPKRSMLKFADLNMAMFPRGTRAPEMVLLKREDLIL